MPVVDVDEKRETVISLNKQDGENTPPPPKKRGVLAADRIKEVISRRDIHLAYVA